MWELHRRPYSVLHWAGYLVGMNSPNDFLLVLRAGLLLTFVGVWVFVGLVRITAQISHTGYGAVFGLC